MPRDLESEKATLARMAPLSKESPPDDDQDPLPLHQSHDPDLLVEEKFKKMKDIHPYSLLLNQEDVDECDWLEHVAFDANEAASKEKVGTVSSSSRSNILRTCIAPCFTSLYVPRPLYLYHAWADIRQQLGFRHHRRPPSAVVPSAERAEVNRLIILGSLSPSSHHCLPISYYMRDNTSRNLSFQV
jgi:hypothetical protein